MSSFKQLILLFICVACILGFYLLKKKQISAKKLNYKLLGYFLAALFYIFSFELLISFAGRDTSNFFIILLSYIFYPVLLTVAPLLYLYIMSFSINRMDKLSIQDNIKHFLLAIVLFIINVFTLIAIQNSPVSSEKHAIFENIAKYLNFSIFFYVFFIQNIVYLYLSAILYINHREVFQIDKESTARTLNWMKLFLMSYLAIFVILYLFQLNGLQPIKLIFRICVLLYVIALIYFGIQDYEELDENLNEDDNTTTLQSNIDFMKIEGLVDTAIASNFYLNSEVNLPMFSQEINSNTKYVSKYINQKYGVSFSAFVHDLRIKYAMEVLKSPQYEHFTIEAIAKMSGFNSKSAFNAVFKKITNQTPTEYRESFHI